MFAGQSSTALLWGPSLVSSFCVHAILKVALHLLGKRRYLSREIPAVSLVGDLGNGAYIHPKLPVVVTLPGAYQPGHRLRYLLQLGFQAVLAHGLLVLRYGADQV